MVLRYPKAVSVVRSQRICDLRTVWKITFKVENEELIWDNLFVSASEDLINDRYLSKSVRY